jgi:YgiT-type zinc finger domain-containing protein
MTPDYQPPFGTCPCGGTYENRKVEVRMTVGGRLVSHSGVPQGACPQCGGRVYKRDVLDALERAAQGG